MAGGWARDDAVNDQIEVSTAEPVARARARAARAAEAPSAEFCAKCDDPIPEARRAALPGVRLCTLCQGERDEARSEGYNRRGSKDSQLR